MFVLPRTHSNGVTHRRGGFPLPFFILPQRLRSKHITRPTISSLKEDITKGMKIIFTVGALTDKLLNLISDSKNIKEVTLVVKDFTKIFVSEQAYRIFCARGGKIKVLQKSKLIAVCVNPTAPNGYVLDSDILCERLQDALGLPVYDIVKNKYDI